MLSKTDVFKVIRLFLFVQCLIDKDVISTMLTSVRITNLVQLELTESSVSPRFFIHHGGYHDLFVCP